MASSSVAHRVSVSGVAGSEAGISGLAVLLGRLFFAAIFVVSAPNDFTHPVIQYAASKGVPFAGVLVPLAGIIALVGGLSVMLGYRAKAGAWLLSLFLVAVTPTMHKFWGISDPMLAQNEMVHFMKNLSMLGAAMFITQVGAGSWSLDSRRS
jgi:putative oxidoreductase